MAQGAHCPDARSWAVRRQREDERIFEHDLMVERRVDRNALNDRDLNLSVAHTLPLRRGMPGRERQLDALVLLSESRHRVEEHGMEVHPFDETDDECADLSSSGLPCAIGSVFRLRQGRPRLVEKNSSSGSEAHAAR